MARYWLSDVVHSLVRSLCDAERGLHAEYTAYGAAPGSVPRLSELSVEFACRIDYRWNPGRHCNDARLRLGRCFFPWFRRPLQRVRIVCRQDDGWRPMVRIEDARERSIAVDAAIHIPPSTGPDALSFSPIKE